MNRESIDNIVKSSRYEVAKWLVGRIVDWFMPIKPSDRRSYDFTARPFNYFSPD
jgi:hypothetical protein